MQRTAICLWLLLAVGLFCLMLALVTYPSVLAHFQLDRLLTSAELHDDAKRQATLEFLTKANGNAWAFWLIVGTAIMVLSGLGLQSLPRPDKP